MGEMVTKPHIHSHVQKVYDEIWGRVEYNFDSVTQKIKELEKVKMDKIYCLELLDRKASVESMEKFVTKIHEMKIKVEEKVMANLHDNLADLKKDMQSKLDIFEFYTKLEE